jgi:tRNA threonylcarbamoyl adenosine modification protein (Sua5/YciO/YrdC/YwlC family)
VSALLAAKGRGPDMPVPVLVGSVATMRAVVADVTPEAEQLVEAFWPGPLTVVCRQQSSLRWNLGETRGTVAVRIPDHDVALELLGRSGPLAVSSANRTGSPPPITCRDARRYLGSLVSVYLDAGELAAAVPSSIVDLTGETPLLLREGALSLAQLREVVPSVLAPA